MARGRPRKVVTDGYAVQFSQEGWEELESVFMASRIPNRDEFVRRAVSLYGHLLHNRNGSDPLVLRINRSDSETVVLGVE